LPRCCKICRSFSAFLTAFRYIPLRLRSQLAGSCLADGLYFLFLRVSRLLRHTPDEAIPLRSIASSKWASPASRFTTPSLHFASFRSSLRSFTLYLSQPHSSICRIRRSFMQQTAITMLPATAWTPANALSNPIWRHSRQQVAPSLGFCNIRSSPP